jgi:hypothetical protein
MTYAYHNTVRLASLSIKPPLPRLSLPFPRSTLQPSMLTTTTPTTAAVAATAAANGKKRRRRSSSSASWKPKKLTKAAREAEKEKKEAREETKQQERVEMAKVLEKIIAELTTAKNVQRLGPHNADYDTIVGNIYKVKRYLHRLVKNNASDDDSEDDATDSDDEDRNGDIAMWTLRDANLILDQLKCANEKRDFIKVCIDRLKARTSKKNAELIEDRLTCLATDDADLLRLIKDMGGDNAMCMFGDYLLHAHLDLPYGFQVDN